MNLMATSYVLLGQSPISHMGKNFRQGGSGGLTTEVIVLFGVLIAIGVVIALAVRHFRGHDGVAYNRPRKLFGELCLAHQLNRQQQQLLQHLARTHQLAQPARLFLEPELFDVPRESVSEEQAVQIAQLRETVLGK